MKIVANEKLYQRNIRTGFFANLAGMALLVASVLVLFNSPDDLGRYLLFLLGGFLLVQIGRALGRWGRRPDLALNRALSGLDNSYTLYHHQGPVPHLLVGPAGLWILLPKHTRGEIHFDKEEERWTVSGGGPLTRLWRRLTQESLGRPHHEAMIEARGLDSYLEKHWGSDETLHVQAAVVFLDEEAEVHAGDAPFPVVPVSKLAGAISKGEQQARLGRAQITRLNEAMEKWV